MGYTAVTYSFSAGSTAKASEVNANFTDIINGLSDGTKDLSVKNITMAAAAVLTMTATSYVSGNLGLGTSTPDAKLHAWVGSAGAVTASNKSAIVAESSDDCAISILTPNNKSSYIYFGCLASETEAYIRYAPNSNQMIFSVATVSALTVDIGNSFIYTDPSIFFGIGTATPLSGLHIASAAGGANKGFITMEEVTAPIASPANSVYIYAVVDGGTGKTKLMAQFQSGAGVEICAEV